jgi:large subunit ribosomal protein L29
MKVNEIVAKKDKDLASEVKTLRDKLSKLRFEVASKETNKHTGIRAMKKDIARINTILREREIQREEEQDEKNA